MINWNSIIDGSIGFEKLAREYVKKEFQFPYGEWKKTSQTRDGNKDAYTIIIGYHPYADQNETWWMEAKYSVSEKKTFLTRFRLDATIVSSIFHRRVSKIIFVTNIDVHSKTISDIRIALERAIGCKEVYFSTRQVLEYWLLNNPNIYQTFFPDPLQPKDIEKTLFVSEDISVYPSGSCHNGYMNPCTHLYIGKTYQAYFKVITTTECDVILTPARKGIRIQDRNLQLSRGENAVRVSFKLTEKFKAWSVREDGRESQRLDLFRINKNCPVLLKNSFEILQDTEFSLTIEAQNKILSHLRIAKRTFQKKPRPQVSVIYGASGTGKSHIVHQFIAQCSMRNEHQYYYSFSEDSTENLTRLFQMTLYLLFPYVNPDEFDAEYLAKIGGETAITQDLLELATFQSTPIQFEQIIQQYCEKHGQILPIKYDWNPRYIYLDNLQNLNVNAWNFLLSIIREIYQKKCPVFFLFVGQTHILESSSFRNLTQHYPTKLYTCVLNTSDIINNISAITSFDMSVHSEVIGDYFPNLIVLLSFLSYVKTSAITELGNINEFITSYIAFINGNLDEMLVLDQFTNIMSNDTLKNLCFSVYTAPNGISAEEYEPTTISTLLQSGLIKFSDLNKLVPFHDIYEQIFRRAYRISKSELGLSYADELDEARDKILFSKSITDIAIIAERITQLRKSGHFYSVCYILDYFFERTSAPSTLLKSSYSEIYYQMYFDYAYATVNCSRKHIGYDYFEMIYSEIENKTSTSMRILKMELLFELMNSNYNIFRFKEAMYRYQQFQEVMRLLIRTNQLSSNRLDNEMYVLCENMRILIQSARGKKKSEPMFLQWRQQLKRESYYHHYIDFCTRYAHTLYTIDPHRALQYTEEAYSCLPSEGHETSKLWCLVKFQYLYLRLLVYHDYHLLEELEAVTETARQNYYSSYRHRNMAICAILYVIGDTQKADERFLRDMAHPRHLRDKMRGFYFETLALHYLSHSDYPKASEALNQAAEVFQGIPSYLRTIHHNQKVLKLRRFSPKRIDFNLGGVLKRDWYYVDPRAD